jgi:glycine/D-amino acid oxidase-like deaminating enzyme
MQTYDVIVIGNGLAGAALSYELAKAGQSVLLMDDGNPHSGTRYSYGGIGYWAATNEWMQGWLKAGLSRHQALSEELGARTQLRELDLLLTVDHHEDLDALKKDYQAFCTPPEFISAQTATEIEPLLSAESIAGAFVTRHAHVDPMSVVGAYNQAFRRLGGHHNISAATSLVRIGNRITGILTESQAYPAGQVIVAAGAYSLKLLQEAGVKVPLFFTHAEIVETPPLDIELRSLILPANNARFNQEANAAKDLSLWQQPDTQISLPVLETGIVQFQNKTARIGQISRFHTAYSPPANPTNSALGMREAIAQKIPALQGTPGTWRHCLVTFTADGLPLIGPVLGVSGLHVFSGFTGPFALVPPVAVSYAQTLGASQSSINENEQLSPMLISRFKA